MLALLAACQQQDETPKVVTVDLKGSPTDPPPPPPQLPGASEPATATSRFQALGTEPFWSVEVGSGNMRYTTPEDMKGQSEVATEAPMGKGLRFAAILNGKPAVLVIQPGTCSDGMSDETYAYTAEFTLGGVTQKGCARKK